MLAEYTTEDGYTLRVFSSLYMDYGLEITKDGEARFYHPCFLSSESYGSTTDTDFDGERLVFDPWTEKEWIECLKDEADDFIESALGADYDTQG